MKKNLPLRIGVGAIVINHESKIFVGKRIDFPKKDKWQMPQGGVNPGENLLSAMRRELLEETSIKSIKILKEIDEWTEYELPNYLLGKIWKGKFRGQKQKWFITKFTGTYDEINIKTSNPEFMEWKWENLENLPKIIVDFKKNLYEELIIKIKPFIN
jgi:putative (di)nucleoside polyphosphate hydrolase